MIRINDYCSIAFSKWIIKQQYFKNFDALTDNNINELVENYLKNNVQKWNLRFFLKLFQDYIIRSDNNISDPRDLIINFEKFCMEDKSLEIIDPNSVDKRVYIYPLLNRFWKYVNIDKPNDIDNKLKCIGVVSYENREGLLEWFNEVKKCYSADILRLFKCYIQNVQTYDFSIFLKWLYKNKKENCSLGVTDYHNLSFDCRKRQIIHNLKNGMVEDNIQQIIKSKDKNIDVFKEIPKEIIEKLADEYINRFPHVKKKTIYDSIRKMRHSRAFFSKFTDIFRNKYGNNFSFERYISCKYHGVFLFRKKDNLSQFLKSFWHDIHVGTGKTIDFYYTDKDIKSDYHCKLWTEKYGNMEIDVKEFPSIFLWEIGSDNKEHILLKSLSHEQIFDVIEYLTGQLETTDFSKSILETNKKIKKLIDSKKTTQNIYMIRNSEIGAVGEKATSNNSTFNK